MWCELIKKKGKLAKKVQCVILYQCSCSNFCQKILHVKTVHSCLEDYFYRIKQVFYDNKPIPQIKFLYNLNQIKLSNLNTNHLQCPPPKPNLKSKPLIWINKTSIVSSSISTKASKHLSSKTNKKKSSQDTLRTKWTKVVAQDGTVSLVKTLALTSSTKPKSMSSSK